MGYYDSNPPDMNYVDISQIKTSKAKGFKLLLGGYNVGFGVQWPSSGYILPQNDYQIRHNGFRGMGNHVEWFARPCPIVPRHGFVESRAITTANEAFAVLAEAKIVDPDAELIITPKLSGIYSGIATNAGVTWGWGNDGVTSGGKGKTFLIPTPMTTPAMWKRTSHIAPSLDIKESETPYVELVEDAGNVVGVQYRPGPPQPTTVNFIPKKTKVTYILYPKDYPDLVKWEEVVLKHKGLPGVVVNMTEGALSSHYAVHAIAIEMPVITDRNVAIGETLISVVSSANRFTNADYSKMAYQAEKWLAFTMSPYRYGYGMDEARGAIGTSIAIVHAMSSWDNTPFLNNFRAMAIPTLIRFLAASCLGELRHWTRVGPGRNQIERKTHLIGRDENLTRRLVYRDVLQETDLRKLIDNFKTATKDFSTKGWSCRKETNRRSKHYGVRNYGYGGPKWATVSKAGLKLAEAFEAFLIKPRKETWTQVVLTANNAIHTVHNGGYAVSKWITDDAMDNIARAPVYGLMNPIAAKMALGRWGPEKG